MTEHTYTFTCDNCQVYRLHTTQELNNLVARGSAIKKEVLNATEKEEYAIRCPHCNIGTMTTSIVSVPETDRGKMHKENVATLTQKEQDRLDRAKKLAELLNAKNKAYGDSFAKSGEVLSILFPDISKEKATVILAVARIVDKLFRISNDPTAFGEDPAMDIAGYGMLLQELVSNE